MKIIGYKAPYDLFKGEVKKGTIYKIDKKNITNSGTCGWTDDYNYSYTNLPLEIVEQWEPVYETPQIPKGSDAERFVQMVGCKQKHTFQKSCGRIAFTFESSTVYFNLDGTFSHIY
jgi:hypothetical protein